jgi:tetratricopeptide (TPR) repeat protein
LQHEAEQIWTALERHPIPFRRRLIELYPGSPNWALAFEVCEASLKSAPKNAEEALELAQLAVFIAERVPGEEGWRSRLLGYCWAYVANARRVGNDLDGAEETLARAWKLWREGDSSDPDFLPEWRLLSFEASLRRAQRRFSEALDLVRRARACQTDTSPRARVNLLLKEVSILSRMGEPERSLKVLADAAPLCEASGDRQMLLALRFNMADGFCELERFDEAAQLLPQVRELAFEQANELDLIRVNWLTARIAAGQGRMAEAVAGLEEVSEDFRAHNLPYNAALSSLDLAVLLLKTGRTVEVQRLATAMGWIFKAKGINREALMALSLFCKAARQEAATVELARKVRAELVEKGTRSVHPRD